MSRSMYNVGRGHFISYTLAYSYSIKTGCLTQVRFGFFSSNVILSPLIFYIFVSLTDLVGLFFCTVGYFNYRYFCNFLLFVTLGLFYGTIMMYEPFMNSNSPLYRENLLLNREQGNSAATIQHLVPMVPTPEEKGAIAMSFMICLSVGFAVFCLASLHTFLVLTAQTTIEFHANGQKKRLSRQRGIQWINPYDLGMKQNFYQVYGSSRHPLWAIFIPSRREPEYLPVPIAGARGKRHLKGDQSGSGNGSSNGNDRDDEKGSDREEASLLLV